MLFIASLSWSVSVRGIALMPCAIIVSGFDVCPRPAVCPNSCVIAAGMYIYVTPPLTPT